MSQKVKGSASLGRGVHEGAVEVGDGVDLNQWSARVSWQTTMSP